jgi:hypothetical protein
MSIIKLLKLLKYQNMVKSKNQKRNELIENLMNIIDDTQCRNKYIRVYKLTIDNLRYHTIVSSNI